MFNFDFLSMTQDIGKFLKAQSAISEWDSGNVLGWRRGINTIAWYS